MGFLTLHKLVTFLLAGFGLVALSFGGELTPISLSLLALGFVASFFSERALERVPRWPARVTQLLLALLLVQLVRGLLSGAWLGLAMEFSGWLTLSRLANRRSGADDQQVVMLAMVQLISATVLTTDLGFAVLFLGYVVVTPWALSLSHLRVAIERNYPPTTTEERGAEARRVLASRRIVGARFLGAMALLSVPTLLLTLGLFLVFPRIGLGFINLGKTQRESVAGFGDRVELGNFGVIRDDPTIVIRISAGRALAPDERLRALRLRGTAFDAYDGRRWTRSSSRSTRLSSVGDYYPLRRFPGAQDYTLRIALERLDEPVMFLPSGSIGFRIPFRGSAGIAYDPMVVLRGQGFDFRYRAQEEQQGLVYEAVVGGLGSDRDLPETDDLDPSARYLGLPSGHERVVALARELRGDERDPLVIAKRFERYLRDEGRFEYTLQQPDTEGRAPLEVFLFEAKRGHCEYFATALAILLRAVEIPARNVTGFIGGEYNAFGGYYAIRQGDAHSWVEAYVPERGWVVFDPTPPASAGFAPARGAFSAIGDAVDALRTYWALRVVGYDLKEQLRGVRAVSAFFRKFSWFSARQGAERSAESGAAGLGQQLRGLPWMWIGGALGLLSLAGVAWTRRRRARARPLSVSVRRVRRLYGQMLRELARRGHTRAAHVTPAQFVAQVATTDAPAAELAQAITQAFERIRYGEQAASNAELRALEARLRDLRRAA